MSTPSKITCTHCSAEFELTDAVARSLRGGLAKEYEERLQTQEAEFSKREQQLAADREQLRLREKNAADEIARQVEKQRRELLAEAAKNEQDRVAVEMADLRRTLEEQRAKLQTAQQGELELRRKQRELEDAKAALELEVARKLDAERAKIAEHARAQGAEEQRLKLAEREQVIGSLQQQIAELQQKAAQGSQQLQGEVLEAAVEEDLRAAFPHDEITATTQGQRGADVLQRVKTNAGLDCGSILWETKRAKNWAPQWIAKLREDQRAAKAELAVLVSTTVPDEVRGFALIEGVWVCDFAAMLPLAAALRQGLVGAAVARQSEVGRQGKMEQLYAYLAGVEFRQRVEGIVESFTAMREDLGRERTAMERIWARREKQITGVIAHTAGMYGSIQGIVGQGALPELKNLELAPPELPLE